MRHFGFCLAITVGALTMGAALYLAMHGVRTGAAATMGLACCGFLVATLYGEAV